MTFVPLGAQLLHATTRSRVETASRRNYVRWHPCVASNRTCAERSMIYIPNGRYTKIARIYGTRSRRLQLILSIHTLLCVRLGIALAFSISTVVFLARRWWVGLITSDLEAKLMARVEISEVSKTKSITWEFHFMKCYENFKKIWKQYDEIYVFLLNISCMKRFQYKYETHMKHYCWFYEHIPPKHKNSEKHIPTSLNNTDIYIYIHKTKFLYYFMTQIRDIYERS